MELLTRDKILATDDRRYRIIPVPEWGGNVRIRSLSEPEYHDYRDSVFTRAGKDREVNERIMRACLCAACIVDAEGVPLFSVNDLTGGKDPSKGRSAHAISLIWKVAAELCGMDDADIEDILKNCEAGRHAGSC